MWMPKWAQVHCGFFTAMRLCIYSFILFNFFAYRAYGLDVAAGFSITDAIYLLFSCFCLSN